MPHQERGHESRQSIWRRLGRCLPYLQPYSRRILALIVITVVSSGLPALEPLGYRAVFDRSTALLRRHSHDVDVLVWPVLCLAALWLLRYVFDVVATLLVWRVRLMVHRDLLADATERLHRLPLAYHQGRGVGETMTRLDRGVGTLMEGLAQLIFQAIPAVVYISVSVAIMLRLSPPLTLLAAVFILPPVLLGRIRAGAFVDRERAGLDRWCTIYDRFQQVLTGIKVVKSFGREADEHAEFIRSVNAAQDETLGSQKVVARLVSARTLAGNFGRVAVLGVGGWLVIQGKIGPGTLVAFLGYVGGLYAPAHALLGLYETLRKAELGLDAVFGVLDAEDAVPDPPSPRAVPELRGDIEIDHVTFSHGGSSRPALADLTLRIHPGEMVAVVGSSGAGKSTLMDLLLRLYDPCSGAVRIDGHDLRAFAQRGLRQKLGVVTQEAFLFEDTVEDNIRYGSPHASRREVLAAAEAARCGFIDRLPRGYETRIGAGGVLLSGGERQRIAIARVLLRDPAIVLLDEPTSCLDVEGEIAVQQAILELAAGRTTLFIAHRLAATTHADRVVVLEEGRLVEEGPPEELMSRPQGRYRKMMRLWHGSVPRGMREGFSSEPALAALS